MRTSFCTSAVILAAAMGGAWWGWAADSPPEPLLYELVINGETFTVEAYKTNQLTSTKRPGTKYEVALRPSQQQRLVLGNLQLDYDRGFQVSQDRAQGVSSGTLKHQLGMVLVVTDAGAKTDTMQRRQLLDSVRQSLEKSFRDAKAQKLTVSEVEEGDFAHTQGVRVSLHYEDQQGFGRNCVIYVLGDQRGTCTCMTQFLDQDAKDGLPLVENVLNSIRFR